MADLLKFSIGMSAPTKHPSPEGNVPHAHADVSLPYESPSIVGKEATKIEKRQPWKGVWPNTKQGDTQMQVYGFKKGEVMEILGNAGNFFAHGDWELEHDTMTPNELEDFKLEAENNTA